MTKSKAFVLFCLSFLAGVFAGSLRLFYVPYVLAILAVLLSVAAFFYYFGHKFMALLVISAAFCVLGIYKISDSFKPNSFENLFGQKVQLEGYITEDPDVRLDKQLIIFKPKGYEQNILITFSLVQEFFYGDELYIDGKITKPENFSDFDYEGYLEVKNVYGLSNRPKALILKSHKLSYFKETILKIKYAFSKRLSGFLKEPENSLMLGILIGDKGGMSTGLTDDFKRTGLSHIVAVSGYNISVIAGALGYLAYLVGRRWSFWLSLFFIFSYTILTGASPSVIRAGIMGFLLLLAYKSGRGYSITPSLCATAFVMVWLNPKILFWDVGFELSFIATAGIVYGVPVMEGLTGWWTQILWLKKILLTTLCATIATLPLLLLKFGTLSLVALLANILVLPTISVVMMLGFLSVLPLFGGGAAFTAGLFLKYMIFVTHRLSLWHYASLDVKIGPLVFVILYGLVVIAYLKLRAKAGRLKFDENQALW
jgi:competence protein ComEC